MPDKKTINALLLEGKFTQAYGILETAIGEEKKVEDLILQHRIIKYWMNRDDKLARVLPPYEKGLDYFDEWFDFLRYMTEQGIPSSSEIESIRYFILSAALESFLAARIENRINDIDLLIKLAYCFRELGKFEEAVQTLQYAYKLNKSQLVLAMLADVNYVRQETLKSQLLFKDLFFLENSISFDTKYIACDRIYEILAAVEKDRIPDFEQFEWIAIYGYIHGFLNVKRELNEREVTQITEEISRLEKHYYTTPQLKGQTTPKLLRKYVLLLEYAHFQQQDQAKKEQLELKMNNVEPTFAQRLIPLAYTPVKTDNER